MEKPLSNPKYEAEKSPKGYIVKHFYPSGERRLCQTKEYFVANSASVFLSSSLSAFSADPLSAALELAKTYAREFLDPSYAEKDEPGVYVIEILEYFGPDDEGYDLIGEEVEKIRYKIERIAKVTEL